MKILTLSNGHLSAEFSSATWPQLVGKLRRHGDLHETAVADVQLVVIGDAKFVRTDEWDGSALIATNAPADRLLQRLARQNARVGANRRFVRSAAGTGRPSRTAKVRRMSAQRETCEL